MKYIKVNITSINCTDGMSDELRYGIIKHNRKERWFP